MQIVNNRQAVATIVQEIRGRKVYKMQRGRTKQVGYKDEGRVLGREGSYLVVLGLAQSSDHHEEIGADNFCVFGV